MNGINIKILNEDIKESKDILRAILKWKNIEKEDIKKFIHADIKEHDPFLLTNMDKAVNKIKDAISNNTKIAIIGDYDVDGICSTTILYLALKKHLQTVEWFIPDRVKDGYGMNNRLIDLANEKGCKLIITVDNGINAHEQVKYANSLDIEVIVTDHHQHTSSELPTDITVNPQIDNNYPLKAICGAMVAFKLVNALFNDLESIDADLYNDLLCFATIATIADVMDLVDENRYYVKKGLVLLNDPKNIGLKTICDRLNINTNIYASDIGFLLAPCLNASGRLETADIAVNLFLSDDEVTAKKYTEKLIELNSKRKDIQKEVKEKISKLIDDNDNFIVVHIEDVGHGVLGIIASDIANIYHKPCFVLAGKDKLSGSGRSVLDYDINSCIQTIEFASGGGHAAACGVSIEKDKIDEFKKLCNEHYINWLNTVEIKESSIDVICKLNFEYINERLINNVKMLEPFGLGNEEPVFYSENVRIESSKIVGKNKNVLQLTLYDDSNMIKAVGFGNVLEKFEKLNKFKVNIVYKLGLNEWPSGTYTPQLLIQEIF